MVWLVLISVESIHGIARAIFLPPIVGDFRARQIGVFIGSALILTVTCRFVGWLGAGEIKSLVLVGLSGSKHMRSVHFSDTLRL